MATTLQTAPQVKNRPAPHEFTQRETEDTEFFEGKITEERITIDDFVQLKMKNVELVDGRVKKIMPTMFSHDRLVTIISGLLNDFVTKQKLGMIASGGSFRTGEN